MEKLKGAEREEWKEEKVGPIMRLKKYWHRGQGDVKRWPCDSGVRREREPWSHRLLIAGDSHSQGGPEKLREKERMGWMEGGGLESVMVGWGWEAWGVEDGA